jgi:hypothetical protein
METYRHDVNIILNELEEVEGKLEELQSENFTDGTIFNNIDAVMMRLRSLQDCLLNHHHHHHHHHRFNVLVSALARVGRFPNMTHIGF